MINILWAMVVAFTFGLGLALGDPFMYELGFHDGLSRAIEIMGGPQQ